MKWREKMYSISSDDSVWGLLWVPCVEIRGPSVQQAFWAVTEAPGRWYCIASAAEWQSMASLTAGRDGPEEP